MNAKKTYCFELYRSDMMPHEGLLRDSCVEAHDLNEAIELIKEVAQKKYSFSVYWIKKSEN
jgi:hypothetical protein